VEGIADDLGTAGTRGYVQRVADAREVGEDLGSPHPGVEGVQAHRGRSFKLGLEHEAPRILTVEHRSPSAVR
jgi:hypothetical protein